MRQGETSQTFTISQRMQANFVRIDFNVQSFRTVSWEAVKVFIALCNCTQFETALFVGLFLFVCLYFTLCHHVRTQREEKTQLEIPKDSFLIRTESIAHLIAININELVDDIG